MSNEPVEIEVDKLLAKSDEVARRRIQRLALGCLIFSCCILLLTRSLVSISPLLFLVLWRRAESHGVNTVLWIRRFVATKSDQQHLANVIDRACRGLGYLVTIRNKTIDKSADWGEARAAATVLPTLMVVVSLRYEPFSSITRVGGAWYWSIAGCLVVIASLIAYRSAFIPLTRFGYQPTIAQLFNRIHHNQKIFTGLIAFQCYGDLWQDAISYILSSADICIADVSRLSKYTIWEIREANHRIGPERMIFLYCNIYSPYSTSKTAAIDEQTRQTLLAECGPQLLAASQTVLFTGPGDTTLESRLRRAIARALIERYQGLD